MDNIMTYIKWRGDISFTERPFNEVDNLILAMLSYIDFNGLVADIDTDNFIMLKDVYNMIAGKESEREYVVHSLSALSFDFFEQVACSKRFGNCKLSNYKDAFDAEQKLQFAALHLELEDGTVYVAFRGTDQTITGWREDFTMSFQTVPAQLEAVKYLEKTITSHKEKEYRVGGHSKGGNLAIYAATMCSSSVQKSIIEIYNNDGPGFSKEMLNTQQYDAIRNRIIRIVPCYSVIGMLFEHEGSCKIVKSSAAGIMQHDAITWEVTGDHFQTAEGLTKECKVMNHILDTWMESVNKEQRKIFTNNFFDSLEAGGARYIYEIAAGGVNGFESILAAMVNSEKEAKIVVGRLIQSCINNIKKINMLELWKTKKIMRGVCITLFGLLFMQLSEHALQIAGVAAVFFLIWFAVQRLIYNSKIIIGKSMKKYIRIFYLAIILLCILLVVQQKAFIISLNFSLGAILISIGAIMLKQILEMPSKK
jgi:hypothetical protein